MHKSLYLVSTPCRLFVTIIWRGESNKTTSKYSINGTYKSLNKIERLQTNVLALYFRFSYNYVKKSNISEIH